MKNKQTVLVYFIALDEKNYENFKKNLFKLQKGDFFNEVHKCGFSSSFERQELEVVQGMLFSENVIVICGQ